MFHEFFFVGGGHLQLRSILSKVSTYSLEVVIMTTLQPMVRLLGSEETLVTTILDIYTVWATATYNHIKDNQINNKVRFAETPCNKSLRDLWWIFSEPMV